MGSANRRSQRGHVRFLRGRDAGRCPSPRLLSPPSGRTFIIADRTRSSFRASSRRSARSRFNARIGLGAIVGLLNWITDSQYYSDMPASLLAMTRPNGTLLCSAQVGSAIVPCLALTPMIFVWRSSVHEAVLTSAQGTTTPSPDGVCQICIRHGAAERHRRRGSTTYDLGLRGTIARRGALLSVAGFWSPDISIQPAREMDHPTPGRLVTPHPGPVARAYGTVADRTHRFDGIHVHRMQV